MRILKWLFLFALWSMVAAFFHYQIPRTDIVRIVETEVQRFDVGRRPMFWSQSDGGTDALATRDIGLIRTFYEDGDDMVFRNEDTGWGWPPYFKFDSASLQAQAANLTSDRADPQWVAVRHYGWRIPVWSVFPNALSVKPVSGPDVLVIPWVAILLLVLFFAVFWAIYTRWRRFRRARIDPAVDDWTAAREERRLERAERRRLKKQQRLGG